MRSWIAIGWTVMVLLLGTAGCSTKGKEGSMQHVPVPTKFTLSGGMEYEPLLTGKPQTTGMRAGRVVLRDGGCNDLHSTGKHEEALVFLAGSGEVRCQGHDPIRAGASEVVYIPPETVHQVCADAGVEMRYVYVVAPAGSP